MGIPGMGVSFSSSALFKITVRSSMRASSMAFAHLSDKPHIKGYLVVSAPACMELSCLFSPIFSISLALICICMSSRLSENRKIPELISAFISSKAYMMVWASSFV
jgi:hypothetical protein